MKLTEGAVGFHLGNDGVEKDEEIVLPLAHQHTDFSVGERVLDKRCSEAWVILHIPRSLGDFGNHHVSIALSHLIGDLLVLLPDDYFWIPEADLDQYAVPRLIEILMERVSTYPSFINK